MFEYFFGQFANAEGKKGCQFYTPQSIVKLLVEMLSPEAEKRVYDGCCGSGGMFVQSERFIELHEHRKGKISIYGQESNPTTYKLVRMNLAIRYISVSCFVLKTYSEAEVISFRPAQTSPKNKFASGTLKTISDITCNVFVVYNRIPLLSVSSVSK